MPYPQRISTLLRLLRERPDPEQGIAELAAGGPHERYLAVVAAAAFGLRPVVTGALRDPDPSVRAEATRQALRLGWATGPELLTDAPPVLRHLILRLLRKHPGEGDAVIDLVRDRYGDHEAAVVLAACTPETVRRLLPELAGSVVSWKVLARRHSAVILDWAEDGPVNWSRLAAPVRACSAAQPARVLDLLERHATSYPVGVDLVPLATRFPERVAALVIAWGRGGGDYIYLHSTVLRHLVTVGLDQLLALDALTAGFLELLPPDRRGAVYAAQPRAEVPSEFRVELLPGHLRVAEARRALAQPRITNDEQWRLYLPAVEALPLLDEEARDSSPWTRAQAYGRMVGVARREPAVVPDVLRRLLQLRNERERVWTPALQELRTLVPHLTSSVVPTLTALTDASIEARDFSPRNREALVELAYAAVGAGDLAEWALGMIARLPIPWDVAKPPPPALVTAALRKRITADTGELLRLVRLLETRARHVPELQDLLRRAAAPTSPADVREEAAELWLDDPHTRPARVAELLREDPSAARLAPVWREVTGYSTTLLDPTLAGPPSFVRRWTPRQQLAYAESRAAVAADEDLEQSVRVRALKDLARVPVAGRELLARFLDARETPIAEAALIALPWTDRPAEALPVLLGHAVGPRARVALPAAARAARFVSAADLLALLRDLLLAPSSTPIGVTSRKAAIRLLVRYGPPETTNLLTEVWHTPGTHPDVRAVVLTALRTPSPSPAVWDVFAEAAASTGRPEIQALLAITPPELSEPARPRFAALVVTAAQSPNRQIAQDAFTQIWRWLPWAPEATALMVAALSDPDFTGPRSYWPVPALRSLVEALLSSSATPVHSVPSLPSSPEAPESPPGQLDSGDSALELVFERLVARDRADREPGTPQRDRPARRCLIRIVGDAAGWARSGRGDLEPVRRAARKLAAQPGFLAEGAELLAALAGERPAPLAEVADLVAGRPALAVRLAGQLGGFGPAAGRLDEVLAGARLLADRGDLAGGLFALALVAGAGRAMRWTEPCRVALRQLRHHPDPDVADASYRRLMED
ncbi:hypothetical protein ACQPZJ_44210 [Actinoplanes sp. CA-054009]